MNSVSHDKSKIRYGTFSLVVVLFTLTYVYLDWFLFTYIWFGLWCLMPFSMKYKLFFIVNILTKLYHIQCYTYITDLIAEKLIFIYISLYRRNIIHKNGYFFKTPFNIENQI
jgi:hypothetical protein